MSKFCEHCGKELLDEAMICPGCGCPAAPAKKEKTQTEELLETTKPVVKKKKKIVRIVLIIVGVILLAAMAVGGYFLYNYIRVEKVKSDLAGETFTYFDSTYYSYLNEFDYTERYLKFDEDAELECHYYYSNIDTGDTYTTDYDIKFEDGMIFIDTNAYKYEVRYDRYGNIEALYDVDSGKLYE